jgi:hypothetical protein
MTGSSYIVTRDNDLLDLMKEGNADGRSLKALQPSLTVLAPPDFLDAMSAPPSDADHPGAAEAPGGEGA